MGKWLSLLIVIFSCTYCTDKAPETETDVSNRGFATKWFRSPPDSQQAPEVIPVDLSHLKKITLGKPLVIPANLNVAEFKGELVSSCDYDNLPVYTPGKEFKARTHNGKDTVIVMRAPSRRKLSPKTMEAGMPEMRLVKDPAVKDRNPYSISYFGKLQGLKHGAVSSSLQDSLGNIWFGTDGGGIARYDGRSFTYYTETEGLSHNRVYSMVMDDAGNIWIGTNGGGLNKFDGKNFTHYTLKEGFISSTVSTLYKDHKGYIWAGTVNGACRIKGDSLLCFDDQSGLPANSVAAITEVSDSHMWFGTTKGASVYNGKNFTWLTTKEGLPGESVYCLTAAENVAVWIGTDKGAVSYDGRVLRKYPATVGFSDAKINAIKIDRINTIWIATQGDGIIKFDGEKTTHLTEDAGLNSNFVSNILEDREGSLWFGTNAAGVSKYNLNFFRHFGEHEGLSANRIWSLLVDKDGRIWSATDGAGIAIYDVKSFSRYGTQQGLISNYVWSLYKDSKNNIWIGTDQGVCKYDGQSITVLAQKDGLICPSVRAIQEDKLGNMWFGTDEGLSCFTGTSFVNYGKQQGLNDLQIWALSCDQKNNLYIATDMDGVNKFDGRDFSRLSKSEGLPSKNVRCVLADSSDNLWIGTFGKGLCRFRNDSLTIFNEKDGVSNNYIFALYQSSRQNLWIGTRFGLTQMTLNPSEKNITSDGTKFQHQFKNYDYADGFLGIGVNAGNTFVQDKKGTLWIAANDRLTAMKSFKEKDKSAPNLQLTGIDLFNETINWQLFENNRDTAITLSNGIHLAGVHFEGLSNWYNIPKHLELSYKNNFITFNFIGITTKQSNKVCYIHKLDGLEENWSAPTLRTEVNYGNLPHGFYTLRVKAIGATGLISNELTYTFVVRPPWWKTWAFRIFMVLVIVFGGMYYLSWHERKLRADKARLEQVVKVRTAEVVKEKKIVEEQKHLIEEKHKEITDSINYAERIQRSFLASKNLLDEHLHDYFVFFQPKDVVSGDFFWASHLKNGNFAFVAADSTGHGVPGAIMSILNILSLELAVKENLNEPSHIFNRARAEIIKRLSRDGSAEGGKDGMDASIIVLNKEKTKLTYSAANNPIWIIRNEKVIELKPDKMPIGKHFKDHIPFEQNDFPLEKGDVIYTLTDGMPDQFGGPRGKKYMYKRLKELLTNISRMPMHMQHLKIKEDFENWKGKISQVDDVTVIGVRV